jgi:catechol 2,3-dioxygenase-like lactoylglutathione lyase family enzyme
MGPQTIPILPSSDFDATAGFYTRLGFEERGRWPQEYLLLARPGVPFELHFWFAGPFDPKKNDFSCYVRWDTAAEARALYDEWAAIELDDGRLTEPQATDYGLLEFALIDPHANLIRIGGRIAASET